MGTKPVAKVNEPSLLPKGMREKLMVAFSLMSVVPLLVMGYILTQYVFPHAEDAGEISLIVGLAIGIALLGFTVARALVLPVIKLAGEAQAIAKGDLERVVEVQATDELGTLGTALNQITLKVRENMAQLRVYGEQTKHLNLEINRRILTLSHLLQVSNLITQQAKLDEVLTFILEKLCQVEEVQLNCLLEPAGDEKSFVIRAVMGEDVHQVEALRNSRIVAPWLWKALREHRTIVLDSASASGHEREMLEQLFGMTNAICQPLVSIGQVVGILFSANKKPDFTFAEDAKELLSVFAKQMAIAMENDILQKRAEELKVIDELTGLYNANYMKSRLEEEIRRAVRYHRPCSLILLNVDGFRQVQDLYGGLAAEQLVKQVADLLRGQVSEVDRVGRITSDEFSLILPERNKREAIELAEAIRQRIEANSFTNGPKPLGQRVTISGGVSENPLDGVNAETLLLKAQEALHKAKQNGKNQVVAC